MTALTVSISFGNKHRHQYNDIVSSAHQHQIRQTDSVNRLPSINTAKNLYEQTAVYKLTKNTNRKTKKKKH